MFIEFGNKSSLRSIVLQNNGYLEIFSLNKFMKQADYILCGNLGTIHIVDKA